MIINARSYSNADSSVALKQQGALTQTTKPHDEADGASTAVSYDKVILKTPSMNASELRAQKVLQLRNSVASGQYRVSAAVLADSMLEKARRGTAPELSFLTGKESYSVPSS